jgi:hypothetical protein
MSKYVCETFKHLSDAQEWLQEHQPVKWQIIYAEERMFWSFAVMAEFEEQS